MPEHVLGQLSPRNLHTARASILCPPPVRLLTCACTRARISVVFRAPSRFQLRSLRGSRDHPAETNDELAFGPCLPPFSVWAATPQPSSQKLPCRRRATAYRSHVTTTLGASAQMLRCRRDSREAQSPPGRVRSRRDLDLRDHLAHGPGRLHHRHLGGGSGIDHQRRRRRAPFCVAGDEAHAASAHRRYARGHARDRGLAQEVAPALPTRPSPRRSLTALSYSRPDAPQSRPAPLPHPAAAFSVHCAPLVRVRHFVRRPLSRRRHRAGWPLRGEGTSRGGRSRVGEARG